MARLLVDMNLSIEWVPLLRSAGLQAVHWSEIGDPRAADGLLMEWASAPNYTVFTHDLDFGTMLAPSRCREPQRPADPMSQSASRSDRLSGPVRPAHLRRRHRAGSLDRRRRTTAKGADPAAQSMRTGLPSTQRETKYHLGWRAQLQLVLQTFARGFRPCSRSGGTADS